MNRREFNRLLTAGILPKTSFSFSGGRPNYSIPQKGNARLLHITDCHAQLNPVYFREPNVNMGFNKALGRTPHAVSESLLYRRGNFNGTFDQLICDALPHELNAEISLSPGFRWGTTVLSGQAITFEHVMDQTCITYPETYARNMLGNEIKAILEDVADNLFHPNPFYQQGGDMVRVGGMNYICDPTAVSGQRITNMALDNGKSIDANKYYKVAGWATVGSKAPGKPIWETVPSYLRNKKTIHITKINSPKLKNIGNNPGIVL